VRVIVKSVFTGPLAVMKQLPIKSANRKIVILVGGRVSGSFDAQDVIKNDRIDRSP